MGKGTAIDERQRIVQYWTLLELFSPQSVPKPTRRSSRPSDKQVIEWEPGDPLPWTSLAPPKPFKNTKMVWQHTVYLGVYDLESTYQHLHRAFGEDRDAYDARRGGRSACGALVLDQRGVLAPDSPTLSSALWAVAQLDAGSPSRSPRWASKFPEAAQRLPEDIDEVEGARRAEYGADHSLPHDEESLFALLRVAHRAAGIDAIPELSSDRIIIASTVRDAGGEEQHTNSDFLNSFFLEDLTLVQKDLHSTRAPKALAEYLTPPSVVRDDSRIDVMSAHQIVDAGASITRLPAGRWPSEPAHSLALRQQFAVNRALNDLSPGAGLMGVNGPPGTGKTTMLRDILAGNVVERATRLSRLRRTDDAFTTQKYEWKSGRFTKAVRQLRPELTGFEMVVASANNTAVENVTAEVPSRTAIAKRWRRSANYFPDIASATLGASAHGEPGSSNAWGLIAARLGNKSNRGSFFSAFWFDKKPRAGSPSDAKTVPGMLTLLKEWASGAREHRSWLDARNAFQAAKARVDKLIQRRQDAQSRLDRLRPAFDEVENHARRARQLNADLFVARQAAQQHVAVLEQAETDLADADVAWDRHLATRPGWLETLLTCGRATREWRAQAGSSEERRSAAVAEAVRARAHGQRLEHQERTLSAHAESAAAALRRAEAEVKTLRHQLAADATAFGASYPGDAWIGDERELHAPWLDQELDVARSDLFLAALRLHEDFLANSARVMIQNLGAAIDVVGGKAPRHLEPEKVLAAWQTFFFVVPMVSTTFASYSRMFAGLGRDSLGWLLIDEAGQASPQIAVGAIWRSRRVISVGDPLQLQPVVTMPHKAQRDIAQAFHVGSEWIPPGASVQTLTDRVSRYGTSLRNGEEDVWVSAPLTVHRRCDDPMFSLCNDIAYNGIMVNGTHRVLDAPGEPDLFDTPAGPRIPTSRWLHEAAATEGTHLQKNQIERLLRAIDALRNDGVAPSEIFAVSPFRAVADRLKQLGREIPDLRAGTIHTAQGGEADVVFIVLGGDPNSPGAKAWASESVNLVNVAASRAKRRLYVIGDRTQWSRYPFFEELSAALGT